MRYFEVPSTTVAEKVSRLLYSLMYPENSSVTTVYLFPWITVAGKVLICIDETQLCPVFQKTFTDTALADLVTTWGNKLTTAQKNALKTYIKSNNQIELIKLVPASLVEQTEAWVKANQPIFK